MRGYNLQRSNKPEKRYTNRKVLSVWNGTAWTRVKTDIEFYSKFYNVTYCKEINEHRIEYYNSNNECVMVFEH